MSINLNDFKLTDEQIEEFVQMMSNNEKKKLFIVSDNLNELLTKLIQHIDKKGYIDDELILYFPEDYAFTVEEYQAFFDVVTNFLGETIGEYVDEECYFKNRLYWMQVGDRVLRFFIMWGQGTATQISWELDPIPSKQIGSLEDFKAWVDKQKIKCI